MFSFFPRSALPTECVLKTPASSLFSMSTTEKTGVYSRDECVCVSAHFFTFIKICLLIKTVVHFQRNREKKKERNVWRFCRENYAMLLSTVERRKKNAAAIILLQSSQVCWTCKSWLDWCTCFHFPTDKMRSRQCALAFFPPFVPSLSRLRLFLSGCFVALTRLHNNHFAVWFFLLCSLLKRVLSKKGMARTYN